MRTLDTPQPFTRRLVLGGLAVTVTAMPLLGCTPSDTGLLEVASDGQFFTARELTLLSDLAELMIPRTETPGATDSRVAEVLDGLMLSWAGERTRAQFRRALQQFDALAHERHARPYAALRPEARYALLERVDRDAFAGPPDGAASDYRRLKDMVFLIHYSSEAANADYVAVPGVYHGDLSQQDYAALIRENAHGG